MYNKIIKIVILIFVVVFVMEFCFMPNYSYAATNAPSATEIIKNVTNLIGGIVSLIVWIPKLELTAIVYVLNDVFSDNIASSNGYIDNNFNPDDVVSPFSIFFNKYKLLDVNIFDITTESNMINTMRISISQWFYVMRNFSAAILLCILIYVGIKMSLSTIAEDKAKYKQMFGDWLVSLILIFLLQYLAIFVIYCNNAIVNFLNDAFEQAELSDAVDQIFSKSLLGMGLNSIMAFFVYVMISFQTMFFLIAYINRMLKVSFLIIISPLISITYSIDKMNDGKAQALNKWLKEFVYTILIQPFHCIMYLTFVNTAVALLVNSSSESAILTDDNQIITGVLAILCLKFINEGEKIVRKIFDFQDNNSSTSMVAGTAMAMAFANKAKKIGTGARKTVNTVKSGANKLSSHLKSDKKTLLNKNGPLANNKIAKGFQKMSNAASKASDKIANSGLGKLASAGKNKINGAKTLYNNSFKGAKKFAGSYSKKATSAMLGVMGAAMVYSSGSTNALTAFGTGTAIARGSNEFFNSSSGRAVNDTKGDVKTQLNKLESAAEKNVNDSRENIGDSAADAIDFDYANASDKEEYVDKKRSDASDKRTSAEDAQEKYHTAYKENQLYKLNSSIQNLEGMSKLSNDDEKKLEEERMKKNKLLEENPGLKGVRHKDDELENMENAARKADEEAILAENEASYASALQNRDSFNDPDKLAAKIALMSQGPSTTQLEKQKNSIMQLIMQLQLQNNGGRELTEQEQEQASSLTRNLAFHIERDIMSGADSSNSVSKLLESEGLSGSLNTDLGKSMMKSIEGYQDLTSQKKISDTMKQMEKLGLSTGALSKEYLKKIT